MKYNNNLKARVNQVFRIEEFFGRLMENELITYCVSLRQKIETN